MPAGEGAGIGDGWWEEPRWGSVEVPAEVFERVSCSPGCVCVLSDGLNLSFSLSLISLLVCPCEGICILVGLTSVLWKSSML